MKAIAMVDRNWGLNDKTGHQPIHLVNDLKRFKTLTNGYTVIMGRKTFEEIDGPLPNRRNIIISTTLKTEDYDTPVISGVDALLSFHLSYDAGLTSWVIGGGQLYRELLPVCTNLYLTRAFTDFDSPSAYFPNIFDDPLHRFKLVSRKYELDVDRTTGISYRVAVEEYVNTRIGEELGFD